MSSAASPLPPLLVVMCTPLCGRLRTTPNRWPRNVGGHFTANSARGTGVTELGDHHREWCTHHHQQWYAQAFRRLVIF